MRGVPLRGEVWLVNWNPGRGSEQEGIRPALVIQNDIGNEKAATTIVAAVSSTVKLYPMNVLVNPARRRAGPAVDRKDEPDSHRVEAAARKEAGGDRAGHHGTGGHGPHVEPLVGMMDAALRLEL